MKEYIEVKHDSFEDYAGKTHHFTIAAISQELPKNGADLKVHQYENNEAHYEVNVYLEDYGTYDYVNSVKKALYVGIAICNPTDTFDAKKGELKAIAKARNSKPVMYAVNPGMINTRVVKALLDQEADWIKDNPEIFIKGYREMKEAYVRNKEMEEMADNFSDLENNVMNALLKDPKALDNVNKYLVWANNQMNGVCGEKQ